jgi:hypothetical protein
VAVLAGSLNRLEELRHIHFKALAEPSQAGEGEVYVLTLHSLEEARRHAAAVGGLLLRPTLLLAQEPHGSGQPRL